MLGAFCIADTKSGHKKFRRYPLTAFFVLKGTRVPGPATPFSKASLVDSRSSFFKYLFVVVGLLCLNYRHVISFVIKDAGGLVPYTVKTKRFDSGPFTKLFHEMPSFFKGLSIIWFTKMLFIQADKNEWCLFNRPFLP